MITSLRGQEPWMARAACRWIDPDTFYPDPSERELAKRAKWFCSSCPVRRECLTHALDHDERLGIWGGLGPRERIALQRKVAQS